MSFVLFNRVTSAFRSATPASSSSSAQKRHLVSAKTLYYLDYFWTASHPQIRHSHDRSPSSSPEPCSPLASRLSHPRLWVCLSGSSGPRGEQHDPVDDTIIMQSSQIWFMHLADTLIQCNLHCIQYISSCISRESNPRSCCCY